MGSYRAIGYIDEQVFHGRDTGKEASVQCCRLPVALDFATIQVPQHTVFQVESSIRFAVLAKDLLEIQSSNSCDSESLT